MKTRNELSHQRKRHRSCRCSYTPFGALQVGTVTQEVWQEAVELLLTGPENAAHSGIHTLEQTLAARWDRDRLSINQAAHVRVHVGVCVCRGLSRLLAGQNSPLFSDVV